MTESNDPAGAAMPMAYRVAGKKTDARYAPGILISTIEIILEASSECVSR